MEMVAEVAKRSQILGFAKLLMGKKKTGFCTSDLKAKNVKRTQIKPQKTNLG
jgi:hypothetical protein